MQGNKVHTDEWSHRPRLSNDTGRWDFRPFGMPKHLTKRANAAVENL